MKVTGTRESFIKMLKERGVSNKLGIGRSTVSNWKRAFAGLDEKNMPTIDKMEEMLLKYGAVVQQEKVWELPTSTCVIIFLSSSLGTWDLLFNLLC
ncbi:MAG TPA: hypothetical protein VF622_12825 [Segetibacter sp.]|jgi:hypothetical protein